MSVQLPPNSTGTVIGTVTVAAKDYQQVCISDPTTVTQMIVVDAAGRISIQGQVAAAAAIGGNPMVIGASDGTNAIRLNAGGAAILAAFSSAGSLLTAEPGNWAVAHTPAAATQATISKAAGAAGVRHVATSLSATLVTVGTAQTAIQLSLRDGATGAGTILWSKTIILPVNSIWEVDLGGFNIVGSAATAMTLEFSAAGAAATVQSVSLSGYDTPAA